MHSAISHLSVFAQPQHSACRRADTDIATKDIEQVDKPVRHIEKHTSDAEAA
jgi:hypothetical protein